MATNRGIRIRYQEIHDILRDRLTDGYYIVIELRDYLTLYYGNKKGTEIIIKSDQLETTICEQDEGCCEFFNWMYYEWVTPNKIEVRNHRDVPFKTEIIFKRRSDD